MSGRSRPPTDEQKTAFFDSNSVRPRAKNETTRGYSPGDAGTGVGLELHTPTRVDPPPPARAAGNPSEPLKVISMKTPAELAAQKRAERQAQLAEPARPPRPLKAEIRSLAEVRQQRQTPPGGMGYLAPPRDVKHVRARRVREVVLWGSVLVIIACAVMLAVWFIAR